MVNVDDRYGRRLADSAPIEIVPFSIGDTADVDVGAAHVRFTWRSPLVAGEARLAVPIGGSFNVMNALAAATTAAALAIPLDAIVAGLAAAEPVPGRFERVTAAVGADEGTPTVDVIVDYAHTPDGLEEVLAAGGAVVGADGRVIVVFGCGGDRDREKRPLMGAVAAGSPIVVVVTSDNPRSEDAGGHHRRHPGGVAEADRDPRRRASPTAPTPSAAPRHGASRATSSSSPARATRRRRRSASASSPSTTASSPATLLEGRADDRRS